MTDSSEMTDMSTRTYPEDWVLTVPPLGADREPAEYPSHSDPVTVKFTVVLSGDEISVARTTRKTGSDDRSGDLAALVLSAAEALAAALGGDVVERLHTYMSTVRRPL